MNDQGVWYVSPAYDLTFSAGPAGEHCSTMMGEGKNPGLTHFLMLADSVGIKKQNALQIINEVQSAISRWAEFAKNAEVSDASLKMVQSALHRHSR